MNQTFFIIAFGFVAISLAGIGFANTLTVDSEAVHALGFGETIHDSATINVNLVEWKLDGDDNVEEVIITLYNPDTVTHEYEVCMLYYNGSGISDTPGTSPDCTIIEIQDDRDEAVTITPSVLRASVISTSFVITQNW